jgi:hypothetical protein
MFLNWFNDSYMLEHRTFKHPKVSGASVAHALQVHHVVITGCRKKFRENRPAS